MLSNRRGPPPVGKTWPSWGRTSCHQVPVLLGRGVRLLDGLEPSVELELVGVVDAPGVTHLTYRVLK